MAVLNFSQSAYEPVSPLDTRTAQLYLWLPEGETAIGLHVEVPTAVTLFDLVGTRSLRLANLSFVDTGGPWQGYTLQRPALRAGDYAIVVRNGSQAVSVANCTFARLSGYALGARGKVKEVTIQKACLRVWFHLNNVMGVHTCPPSVVFMK